MFMWMAHQAVHAGNLNGDPLQAPHKYVKRFGNIKDVPRKIFAGMNRLFIPKLTRNAIYFNANKQFMLTTFPCIKNLLIHP